MDKRIVLSLFDRTLAEKEPELGIPELTDGFQFYGGGCAGGMFPVSFFSEVLDPGTWKIHIAFRALTDVKMLYVFTGRKQLREILTLKKGQKFEGTYFQNLAPIVPRHFDRIYHAERLFITICTQNPEAIEIVECYGAKEQVPVIWLAGDSTVTDQPGVIPYDPGVVFSSWGQCLPAFLADPIALDNQAHSGLTTETFRSEGHMDLIKQRIHPDDMVLFQFGHNDQKLPHLLADREYPENLRRFIEDVREFGAQPVLVTPLSRNIWSKEGRYLELLGAHAQAVRNVGEKEAVFVIDLHEYSKNLIFREGAGKSCRYFHPGDYTHTCEYGAYRVAGWMAGELKKLFAQKFRHMKESVKFEPPEDHWQQFGGYKAVCGGNRQEEQFDYIEKSSTDLVAAIQKALVGRE